MPRRTKVQIQKDNEMLLRKKKDALDKLNSHINSVSNMRPDDMDKISRFIILFIKCETVYKTLYPEMKRTQDELIDVKKLKFNVQKFEAALRFFGISYDHDKMNTMFSSKKSYLVCRDNIVHGLKPDSINEVIENFNVMESTMSEFLSNVSKGLPAL